MKKVQLHQKHNGKLSSRTINDVDKYIDDLRADMGDEYVESELDACLKEIEKGQSMSGTSNGVPFFITCE